MVSSIIRGYETNDKKLLANLLEATEELLKLDEFYGLRRSEGSVAFLFERNGALNALEELQKHPNNKIYDLCVHILTVYFEAEENGMNDSAIPNNNNNAIQSNGY
jgi:hypothetical protein